MSFVAQSHPEFATEQEELAAELVQLAQQIAAWQSGRSPSISNEEMLRRYPALGSTKTYRRVTKGDTSSLILPAQIEKYRGVWRQIEEGSGDNGPEEIYTDLTPAFETARAAALLIPQHGRERLMLIEGPTGSGKTMSLANIARRYPSTTVLADASTAWKNPNCMVGDILIAAGVYTDPAEDETSKLPVRYADRLAALKSHFRAKRKILLIDEGHHMAAESLNVLKGLLNDSDLLIIVACIDTLWRKLASAAWAEASQLVLNRMFERVRLMPPAPEDAEMYLSRRVPALAESGDGWKAALGTVTAAAKSYGSFAFLRRLAKRLNQKDAITRETVAGEVDSLVKALRTRNSNPADS